MNEDDERLAMSARLKEAREYCGFSQDEVAKYLKISRSAVSLIETGSRKIDALELKKLAELYQSSIVDLTGQSSKDPEPNSVKLVARATAELSKEDRDEVLRFAQFLQSRKNEKTK